MARNSTLFWKLAWWSLAVEAGRVFWADQNGDYLHHIMAHNASYCQKTQQWKWSQIMILYYKILNLKKIAKISGVRSFYAAAKIDSWATAKLSYHKYKTISIVINNLFNFAATLKTNFQYSERSDFWRDFVLRLAMTATLVEVKARNRLLKKPPC